MINARDLKLDAIQLYIQCSSDFVTVLPVPDSTLTVTHFSEQILTYRILWLFGPCPMVVTESDMACS